MIVADLSQNPGISDASARQTQLTDITSPLLKTGS